MGKKEYLSAYNLIPILLLSFFVAGLQQNLQITLFVERKTFWVPIVVIFGCVINVLMNITLIPTLKIFGAALANLCTRLSIAAFWFFIAMKYNKINYEWMRIGKIIFVGVVLYILGRFISFSNLYFEIFWKFILLFLFPTLLFVHNFYHEEEKHKITAFLRKSFKLINKKVC